MKFATTAEAQAYLEDQGTLQPGDEGFWKVWGASVHDIRPGDLLASLVTVDEPEDGDGGVVKYDLVLDTFQAKAHPVRVGIVTDEGKMTIGALTPIALFRWETHYTLAGSVR